MFAVVSTGGKQYKVAVGDELQVERLEGEAGQSIELGNVLMVADGGDVMIGAPALDKAIVRATVVEQGRGPKVRIFKYKPKKRYRKRAGHRQLYTRLKIDEIVA